MTYERCCCVVANVQPGSARTLIHCEDNISVSPDSPNNPASAFACPFPCEPLQFASPHLEREALGYLVHGRGLDPAVRILTTGHFAGLALAIKRTAHGVPCRRGNRHFLCTWHKQADVVTATWPLTRPEDAFTGTRMPYRRADPAQYAQDRKSGLRTHRKQQKQYERVLTAPETCLPDV